MAQTTSPDNIPSPDLGDQYALTQDLANIADATQNALIKRANAYTGTSAQRTAFTAAPVGTLWSDTDGNRSVWKRGTSGWDALVPKMSRGTLTKTTGTLSQIGSSGVYGVNSTVVVPAVAPAGHVLRVTCTYVGGGWSTFTQLVNSESGSSTTVTFAFMQVGGTASRNLELLWEVIPVL